MKLTIQITPSEKGPLLSSKYDDRADAAYRPATSADDLKKMAGQVIDEWIEANAKAAALFKLNMKGEP